MFLYVIKEIIKSILYKGYKYRNCSVFNSNIYYYVTVFLILELPSLLENKKTCFLK